MIVVWLFQLGSYESEMISIKEWSIVKLYPNLSKTKEIDSRRRHLHPNKLCICMHQHFMVFDVFFQL